LAGPAGSAVGDPGRALPVSGGKMMRADDPPEVFEEVAKLLTFYRDRIEADVKKLREHCAMPAEFNAVAIGYVSEIANNCPDPVLKDTVKRLARQKFRREDELWAA
jgi:hypothetical protein